ncbi:MAG: DUF1893 domain-containing protein [Coprobacillaceae bacterium]
MKAKELLIKEGYTLVGVKEDIVYTSTFNGIRPIMDKVKDNALYFKDYEIADKVIGKSAALLLVRSQVKSIDALVLSEHAKTLLDTYKIPYTYDTLVPYIINRNKDGMCPMEESVISITDLEEGFKALQATLKRLQGGK